MIKKPLQGDTQEKAYKERSLDRVHRFLMANDTVRAFVVHGNRVVREMKANHSLGPLETMLMGQASLGALLMAAGLKDEGRIRLQWKCGGPVGHLSVEADSHGTVRGFLGNNPIALPENADKAPVDFFGPGFITVTRLFSGMAEPRSSTVALKYGKIAQDLTVWHMESEQVPTAMALSVAFDNEGEPSGAGGLFLQTLPGAGEDVTAALEGALESLPSLGEAFANGEDAKSIVMNVFAEHSPRYLNSSRVEFFCPCDADLFKRYLQGLGADDRKEIREEGPFPLTITCQNCSTVYEFSKEEVQKFLG